MAGLGAASEAPTVGRLVLLDSAGFMRLRVGMSVLHPTVAWLLNAKDTNSAALLSLMMAPEHSQSQTS